MPETPPPPLGWTPPVLLLDYGRKARVVTQADVDEWIEMERRYEFIVQAVRENIIPFMPKLADG